MNYDDVLAAVNWWQVGGISFAVWFIVSLFLYHFYPEYVCSLNKDRLPPYLKEYEHCFDTQRTKIHYEDFYHVCGKSPCIGERYQARMVFWPIFLVLAVLERVFRIVDAVVRRFARAVFRVFFQPKQLKPVELHATNYRVSADIPPVNAEEDHLNNNSPRNGVMR